MDSGENIPAHSNDTEPGVCESCCDNVATMTTQLHNLQTTHPAPSLNQELEPFTEKQAQPRTANISQH